MNATALAVLIRVPALSVAEALRQITRHIRPTRGQQKGAVVHDSQEAT